MHICSTPLYPFPWRYDYITVTEHTLHSAVLQLNWLPSGTLKLHTPGTERRWVLRPTTVRRPSWQPSTSVSWFDEKEDDTLAVRIPLRNPPGAATTSSYSCPCSPVGADGNPGGVCPACRDGAGGDPCANGPCCLELKCADSGLT